MVKIRLLLYLSAFNIANCLEQRCNSEIYATLPYIVEHAVWRNWNQALIFASDLNSDCRWMFLGFIKCLGANGVAVALNVQRKPRFNINIGVITFWMNVGQNISTLTKHITELNAWELNTASADWIIASPSIHSLQHINNVLNTTELRYDQNIVVAFPGDLYESNKVLCKGKFQYRLNSLKNLKTRSHEHFRSRIWTEVNNETSYYKSSKANLNIAKNKKIKRNDHEVPLLGSGIVGFNFTGQFDIRNASELVMKKSLILKPRTSVHAVQYFKVRRNSTLYASYLGHWSPERSMSSMEMPYPVEARNFMGEMLVVGRCNYTEEKAVPDEDGPSEPGLLDDLLHYLIVRMNGTSLTRYYSKLGYRTYEGAWSGLLGALLDHSVDIALEPVTQQASRQQEIDYIFPIAETMCNIYIRNQETSSIRDIFLAPFSTSLLVCVAAVAMLAAGVIVVITKVSRSFLKRQIRAMGYTEALVWSTGILCQQGGTCSPSSSAASILLIVCLFYGLITYNAYAAFITSVLSVRVANVGTVADVLQSPNMKIGYIKNGADQIYLMSTRDIQLNAFYIRGYSEAENLVSSLEEGIVRAATQDYAFFAGQRAARSTLKSMSQARGRCGLRELPVHSTRSQLSFPLPRRSPYSRPILVSGGFDARSVNSLLRLRSGGTLSRLAARLVPAMPQCEAPSGFASARAVDVQTAFLVIVTGLTASLAIGIGEYCWNTRRVKWIVLKKYYYEITRFFR